MSLSDRMSLSDLEGLDNESDVEQKLVYPFLSSPAPFGLGYSSGNIKTKHDIRRFAIEKRSGRKLYYPDYVIMISGLPVIVVEVKPPTDQLDEAHREARLYAGELNAQFPTDINPVSIVISTNGKDVWLGNVDEESPYVTLGVNNLDPSDILFDRLTKDAGYNTLSKYVDRLLSRFKPTKFFKPVRMIGGESVRDEEIAPNQFGLSLSFDFGHIFNPETHIQRSFVVRNAYIPSKRRERYVESIDRAIRAVRHRSDAVATTLEDSGNPKELIDALRKEENMSHNLMLFIGSVGSGKSTFIDYLQEVALPQDLRDSIEWVHINMNVAPISGDKIHNWLHERVSEGLKRSHEEIDFDSLDTLLKVFSVEVERFRKSIGALLEGDQQELKRRLADELQALLADASKSAQALVRYLVAERDKKLVVVLDNCDRRVRDEQLLMFEASQWLKSDLKCLVMLPIREETFDNHRTEPPLDTAIKNLAFRIEPPSFQSVLEKRLDLALSQINSKTVVSEFTLSNNARVTYDPDNLKYYLQSIRKSIYEHGRFVRQILVGLSGRDLRRAMELFLEFCQSGHISENDIFKIIQSKGEYKLDFETIAHVVLRQNNKFYREDRSYIKNMFYIDIDDSYPSHALRLSVLGWLNKHIKTLGPLNIEGYHKASRIVSELQPMGFSKDAVMRELLFLVEARCVVTESLVVDAVDEEDLVRIAPAGLVHLDLLPNEHYLAAVAEDTWLSSEAHAARISRSIAKEDYHLTTRAAFDVAGVFADYLSANADKTLADPAKVLDVDAGNQYFDLDYVLSGFNESRESYSLTDPWVNLTDSLKVGDALTRKISSVHPVYGLFVEIVNGIDGLIHIDRTSKDIFKYHKGDNIDVVIENIDTVQRRIRLREA